MSEPRWMMMLRSAVDRAGSKKAVADMLGYSRTAVSLILDGKYGDRSTEAIERAVLLKLDFVSCPHLAADIARGDCDVHRTRPMPRSNPAKLRHWVACGRCPVSQAAEAAEGQAQRPAAVGGRG